MTSTNMVELVWKGPIGIGSLPKRLKIIYASCPQELLNPVESALISHLRNQEVIRKKADDKMDLTCDNRRAQNFGELQSILLKLNFRNLGGKSADDFLELFPDESILAERANT